jgi:hypothetical protein
LSINIARSAAEENVLVSVLRVAPLVYTKELMVTVVPFGCAAKVDAGVSSTHVAYVESTGEDSRISGFCTELPAVEVVPSGLVIFRVPAALSHDTSTASAGGGDFCGGVASRRR